MNLQAVVAKILQWSLAKPTHNQGRRFHALLHEKGARYTPLQRFWARMNYPELAAVMLRLVRICMPSGKKVTDIGKPVQAVFFVVSGALSESPSPDCEDEAADSGYDPEPSMLGANDIFGDIFPLDSPTFCRTEIRTLTDVELVKINKAVLEEISKNFPKIKKLLHELYRSDNRHRCDRTWQTVRRTQRFGIPAKTEISCFVPQSEEKSIYLSGIAVDLSLGGMCMDVQSHLDEGAQARLKGKIVRLHLELLNDEVDLDVTGRVVWHRKHTTDRGEEAVYIGIRFDSLGRNDRKLLSNYCSRNAGE
jgi:hypothetical protein